MSQTKAQLIDNLVQPITGALGSQSAPTFSFTADPNTGLFSPGADQLSLSTGGTGRLFINSTGQTSLGTASALSGATLTIAGNCLAITGQNLAHSANSLRMGEEGSGLAELRAYGPNVSTAGSFRFRVSRSDGSNSSDIVIDSSGRLGIGTSSPANILHVTPANSSGASATDGVRVSAGTSSVGINFGANSSGTFGWIQSSNAGVAFAPTVINPQGGNVGIGTTTPGQSLDVNGNIRVGSNQRVMFGPAGFEAGIKYSSSGNFQIAARAGEAITFNGGEDGTERARIDSSGRLLVGTSSTSAADVKFVAQVASGTTGPSSGTAPKGIAINHPGGDGSYGGLWFSEGFGDDQGISGIAGSRTSDYQTELRFFTNNTNSARSFTERMKIDNLGRVNTFPVNDGYLVRTEVGAGTTYYLYAGNRNRSAGETTTFFVWSNGNVQNTNGSYTAISDVKLKENIVDANSQWNDLKAIKIRNWNFKEETGHEIHRQIGPIAQELEEVCPGLVFETPDRDEDGNETGEVTKGVNQSVLYMKAVKALQEAMERIEQLEAEMAEVKAQLS